MSRHTPSVYDARFNVRLGCLVLLFSAYLAYEAEARLTLSDWRHYLLSGAASASGAVTALFVALFLLWNGWLIRRNVHQPEEFWENYTKRVRARYMPAFYVLAAPLTLAVASLLVLHRPLAVGVLTGPTGLIDFVVLCNVTGLITP